MTRRQPTTDQYSTQFLSNASRPIDATRFGAPLHPNSSSSVYISTDMCSAHILRYNVSIQIYVLCPSILLFCTHTVHKYSYGYNTQLFALFHKVLCAPQRSLSFPSHLCHINYISKTRDIRSAPLLSLSSRSTPQRLCRVYCTVKISRLRAASFCLR